MGASSSSPSSILKESRILLDSLTSFSPIPEDFHSLVSEFGSKLLLSKQSIQSSLESEDFELLVRPYTDILHRSIHLSELLTSTASLLVKFPDDDAADDTSVLGHCFLSSILFNSCISHPDFSSLSDLDTFVIVCFKVFMNNLPPPESWSILLSILIDYHLFVSPLAYPSDMTDQLSDLLSSISDLDLDLCDMKFQIFFIGVNGSVPFAFSTEIQYFSKANTKFSFQ
ncbi:hypothetical protein GEMRC1_011857 [Eukaryota sp. GEM-RC1]